MHHEDPGAHWSTLPALHAKIEAEIDPALKVPNTAWWLFKVYVLALVFPSLGTKQVGRAAYETGSGRVENLESGDVDAVDAGVNAQMV